ncbi:hypothetical protein B0H10DRAFT_1975137, partial [Mycena sp. CBHHK59/15]
WPTVPHFHVPVPLFPWFHPQDCEAMTSKLHIPCTTYDILDTISNPLETTLEEDDEWVTTSAATKVKPNMILYLRSPDVDTCVGLRSEPMRKRLLSEAEDLGPPSSPLSTPSPSKRLRLEEAIISSSSAPISADPPLGKRAPFPLAYACDMDPLFKKIQDLPPGLKAEQQFEAVFGHLDVEFTPSTYSNSWNAWLNVPDAVIAMAVAKGHRFGGEWSPIVTAWRNSQKGKVPLFSSQFSFYSRHSQPLNLQQLKDIICAHKGAALANTAPRTVNTAVTRILQLKIDVDWEQVFLNTAGNSTLNTDDPSPGRRVDALFVKHLAKKHIQKPLEFMTPPSTPKQPKEMEVDKPKQLKEMEVDKPTVVTADQGIPSTVIQKKADVAADHMDVDSPSNGKGADADVLDGKGTDLRWKMVRGPPPTSDYQLIGFKGPADQVWVIRVLVKDCTKVPGNVATKFAPSLDILLTAVSCRTQALAQRVCVFPSSSRKDRDNITVAPWDVYWCLAGYPWIIGPCARLHNHQEEVQFNLSEAMFCEIPVTGPDNALRLMVVFKHPNDTSRRVLGVEETMEDPANIDHIEPYSGVDAIKEEQDVKPVINTKVSPETVAKNNQIILFLTEALKHRTTVTDLRDTKVTARNSASPMKIWAWISEFTYLMSTYPNVTATLDPPRDLLGKRISAEIWAVVLGRGTNYLKNA